MMAIAKTIPGVRNFLVEFDWGKRFQGSFCLRCAAIGFFFLGSVLTRCLSHVFFKIIFTVNTGKT